MQRNICHRWVGLVWVTKTGPTAMSGSLSPWGYSVRLCFVRAGGVERPSHGPYIPSDYGPLRAVFHRSSCFSASTYRPDIVSSAGIRYPPATAVDNKRQFSPVRPSVRVGPVAGVCWRCSRSPASLALRDWKRDPRAPASELISREDGGKDRCSRPQPKPDSSEAAIVFFQ